MRLLVYHGTDFAIAQQIRSEGFKPKLNPEHWLGNGIYFFTDETLAKWWSAHKPTNKHGTEIKVPAVIKATLIINDERVLDLRKLNDYIKFLEWENEYKQKIIEQARSSNGKCLIDSKKYRCDFFDFVFKEKNMDVIIGSFHKPDQPYCPPETEDILRRLSLSYSEVQVSVKSDKQNEILKITDIVELLSELGDNNEQEHK